MPDGEWMDTPYVRVFYSLRRDHPEVWKSDARLAWYLRLLVKANQSYPDPADLPRAIPDEVLLALVGSGAIDATGDGAYLIHGLDRLRASDTRRGVLGGLARARAAARDASGRYYAGRSAGPATEEVAGPVAGRLNGKSAPVAGALAGPATPDEPLVKPLDQQPSSNVGPALSSDIDVDRDVLLDPSRGRGSTSSPSSRPARPRAPDAAPASFGTTRGHRPAAIEGCDDPDAHRNEWRQIAGVWRCQTCIVAHRDDEPSFSERMSKYHGDGPF